MYRDFIKRPYLLLFAAALVCLFFIARQMNQPGRIQASVKDDAEGKIIVIPVQLERDVYGIAMVDTVGEKLWLYKLNYRGPAYSRLQLFAARSWKYDKLLEQYNTAEPKPEQVKIMLETLSGKQIRTTDVNIPETTEPEK